MISLVDIILEMPLLLLLHHSGTAKEQCVLRYPYLPFALLNCLTISWATEQYCATGAILKPLCLSKQLTHCSQQHIDQLFRGHIMQVVCKLCFPATCNTFVLHNMFNIKIGFARERVKRVSSILTSQHLLRIQPVFLLRQLCQVGFFLKTLIFIVHNCSRSYVLLPAARNRFIIPVLRM